MHFQKKLSAIAASTALVFTGFAPAMAAPVNPAAAPLLLARLQKINAPMTVIIVVTGEITTAMMIVVQTTVAIGAQVPWILPLIFAPMPPNGKQGIMRVFPK